jgi:chromosome segregation ATPase
MARPETPYELVAEICRKLAAKGQNPSYGLVAAELPGNPSKGTILNHLRIYKETRDLAATVDTGLSESFEQAARAEIAGHIARTTETLGKKVEDANRAADEALAELDKSEARAEELEQELAAAKHLAEQFRQAGETAAAVADQNSQTLNKRVLDLEQERDQLIKAGEASRTEAAKALMQLERADKAAAEARERNKALEQKIEDLAQVKTEAEQRAAVAAERSKALEQKIEDLAQVKTEAEQRAAVAEARIEELKEKTAGIRTELKETQTEKATLETAIEVSRKENAKADQAAAVAGQKAMDLADKTALLQANLDEARKRIKELEKTRV